MANNKYRGAVAKALKILGDQGYFHVEERVDNSFAAKVYARKASFTLGDHWDSYKEQSPGITQCVSILWAPDKGFIIVEFTTPEPDFKHPSTVTAAISSMPLDEFVRIPPSTPAQKFIQEYVEAPPRSEASPLYKKLIAAHHPRGTS